MRDRLGQTATITMLTAALLPGKTGCVQLENRSAKTVHTTTTQFEADLLQSSSQTARVYTRIEQWRSELKEMSEGLRRLTLELGDKAIGATDDQLVGFAKEIDDATKLIQGVAQEYASQFMLQDCQGNDIYSAAEIYLFQYPYIYDAIPYLNILESAPLAYEATKAYWWHVYAYADVESPQELEKVWRVSRADWPDEIARQVTYGRIVGLAYLDIGNTEKSRAVLEEALQLGTKQPALIKGKDSNFGYDPRVVSAGSLARTACLIATLSDDTRRQAVLDHYKNALKDIPNIDNLIESTWEDYREYGHLLPRLTGQALTGKVIDTDALRGKIIILEFSASGCRGCNDAIPYLKRLYSEFESEVAIISISSDADLATVAKWAFEKEITWPILGGSKGWQEPAYEQFRISGIPYCIVADSLGKIRHQGVSEERLTSVVKRLLSEKSEKK